MFKKKVVRKQPAAMRRRSNDDSDDDDDDKAAALGDDDKDAKTATTTQQLLAQTRKKRKLLSAAQSKRGVNATELLLQQPREEMAGSTASSTSNTAKSSAVKTAAETSRDGALDRQHRAAMEAFIEQRMGNKPETTITDPSLTVNTTSQVPLTEEALYADLAAQSARLAGKPLTATDDDVDQERGAVLVAGTGIAEVILPVADRLRVVQETTQAAAAAAQQTRRPNAARLSAVPNRFAVATNLTAQEFSAQYNNNRGDAGAKDGAAATAETSIDASRPGFEAVRQAAPQRAGGALTTNSKRADQASDHKVYTKFVTRQRELRK